MTCTSHEPFLVRMRCRATILPPALRQLWGKFPSSPQRFPLMIPNVVSVYDLRIDLVMFDGESRTTLVDLTITRIFRRV